MKTFYEPLATFLIVFVVLSGVTGKIKLFPKVGLHLHVPSVHSLVDSFLAEHLAVTSLKTLTVRYSSLSM